MAYRGSRDNHFSFRVPQSSCDIYQSTSGEEWIEVKLPGATKTSWYSFMVQPDQVCYDAAHPGEYNIIEGLNQKTDIIVSQKIIENDKRTVLQDTRQSKDPVELMNYFADCNADNIIAAKIGATLVPSGTAKQMGKVAPKSKHYNPAQPSKFRNEKSRETIGFPLTGMNNEATGPGLE
jgi:hypothetical protein